VDELYDALSLIGEQSKVNVILFHMVGIQTRPI